MSLEACVVCLDTSAFARDADLHPTRMSAQLDAASLVANAKLKAHRENAVGIVTMGGEGARVSVAPTSEFGRIHSALHELSPKGEADFVRGILVAQLALKHRMNKTQRQRIFLFVGSPVTIGEKQLVQLGRQLKKNNIALDIVCLSNVEENRQKLAAMHAAVNSNDTSRYVEYPPGSGSVLSDVLVSSMLLHDPEAAAAAAGGGANGEGGPDAAETAAAVNEFGVDPNVDPDLYMVLRISLEEARQQQQQQQQQEAGAAAAVTTHDTIAAGDVASAVAQIEGLENMDEELRQAVFLSLQDYGGDAATAAAAATTNPQDQSDGCPGDGAEQPQSGDGTTGSQPGQNQDEEQQGGGSANVNEPGGGKSTSGTD